MVRRRSTLAIIVAVSLALLAPATRDASAQSKKKKKPAAAAAEPQPAAPPGEHAPEVLTSWTEFCGVWMQKLVERERFNKTQIKWRPSAAGVEGDYVGYSSEHTCDLRPPTSGGIAIGRLTYREMIYRKRGASEEAAGTSEPEVIEITEITEIFRREKGKWIY